MADSDVDIKISGDATGAQKAFKDTSDAATAAKEAVGTAFEGLGSVLDALRDHFVALTAILAGGAAFKESIAATKEFVGNVTALSKAAGISAQEASGLNVALEDVGSNAETYTGALSKLTRQVRTNEAGLNALGVATRDSNGEFLDGRALMDSTIATLNTYKEGTDRNLAAQVAFGKGAAESAALLKLNTDIQEEGRKKAEELNLVIGPGTQAAVKAYKLAMNDVGDIMKGVEVTLGKAVMPVLADLAQWFASTGPAAIAIFKPVAAGIADTMRIVIDVVKGLWQFFADAFSAIGQIFTGAGIESISFADVVRNTFALVGIALLAVKEGFQLAFEGIRAAVTAVLGVLRTFANVASAAFARDWGGAKAAWKAGLADIETEVSESTKRILKIQTDAAAAMQQLAMGEGYKRPEDKDSEVKKPSGSRSFTDPNAKDKDGPTIIAQYEAELAAKKLQIDEENALNGTFYQMSKQAEADFWQAKAATVEKGSKEYYQIEKKYIDARLAVNKDAFDAELAGLKQQEEAVRYDFDAKLGYANAELNLIRQKFGEQSKEYAKGLEEIAKLQREKSDQSKQISETQSDAAAKALLAQIDLEEQQAQLEVQLWQKTEQQLLADQQGFENRRYAIQVQAAQARAAIADKEGNVVEKAKIDAQLEQLEQQHQLRMRTIVNQSVLQQTQVMRNLYSSLQGNFATAINSMLNGTFKLRDFMHNVLGSITQAMSTAVAQMVTDWLAGELKKAAASRLTHMAQIQGAAASAAANAYDAIVGIPYVGPFLAVAAAAAAYAGVLAFGSDVPSAEGGYDIPAGVNPMVQTHEREMILPAKHADVIRSLADGGGGAAAAGGDVHLHVHAVDGDSVKKLFRDNGHHLVAALNAQKRNFNPGLR